MGTLAARPACMPRLQPIAFGSLLLHCLARGEHASLCSNECRYSRDGECDDSGPASESSTCALGTDCQDCGERSESELGALLCNNQCHTASDGQCDDAGPGSRFRSCTLGSDCADCGKRATGSKCDRNNRISLCASSCLFTSDGHCDDGGPGSQFDSCSLGSDCDDCGGRSQPCGISDEDAFYDGKDNSQPPSPPASCFGDGGRKRCDMSVCSLQMQSGMCRQCKCAACSFCSAPKGLHNSYISLQPPSPFPPSPLSPPPWKFSCDLLEGRENVRLRARPHWCYTLAPSECDKSFTLDSHSGTGEQVLSICHLIKDKCESMFVDQRLYLNKCPTHTVPAMTTSAKRTQPVVEAPPPPSPPPPTPCIPLSGMCNIRGPQRKWDCCQNPDVGEASCLKIDNSLSQCRLKCEQGWACDTSSSTDASGHLITSRLGEASSSLSPRPSSSGLLHNHSSPPSQAPLVHESTNSPIEVVRSTRTPDPCKSCRVVDPSQTGRSWRAISSPRFGNGCFTYFSAITILKSNAGIWPGVPNFRTENLSDGMLVSPSRCYQLPEGFECFKSPGRACSSEAKEGGPQEVESTKSSYAAHFVNVYSPVLSFSAHLPVSVLAFVCLAVVLPCIWISVCHWQSLNRRFSRHSWTGMQKIPGEEPDAECDAHDDVDESPGVGSKHSHQVVSL